MRSRFLVVVVAMSLSGALGQGIAGASPIPSYSISCAVGGNTTADWQRARVDQVDFEWFAPAGSSGVFETVTVPVTSKGRHGSAFTTTLLSSTGVAPAGVTVTFTHADGTADHVEATCT